MHKQEKKRNIKTRTKYDAEQKRKNRPGAALLHLIEKRAGLEEAEFFFLSYIVTAALGDHRSGCFRVLFVLLPINYPRGAELVGCIR